MKILIKLAIGICCVGLMGCGYYGGCGYCDGDCGNDCCLTCPDYNHDSVCGQYSCTDNTWIDEYTNDCPGPYTCNVDP